MNLLKRTGMMLALALAWSAAEAEITLPAVFADGMVLQQQSRVKIWGKAKPDTEVSVVSSWNWQTARAKADAEGRWTVQVETPEAGGPYDLVVDNAGDSREIRDVLIGEVWLCSGQSNMEEPMKGYPSQGIENNLQDIMSSKDDGLRLFTVGKARSNVPLDSLKGEWQAACPDVTAEFSATAYYFGRYLRRALQVPVGLICSSVGGTPVEAWTSRETLGGFPYVDLPGLDERRKGWQTPTTLYNAMIHPIEGYGIKGCIWYQGEANCEHSETYAELLTAMVASLRAGWGIGDFPFLYCQIAPYDYSIVTKAGQPVVNSAYLREAQSKAEKMIPGSSMVVLLDGGLTGGIHPRKKWLAGERLAMRALSQAYGSKVNTESPRFASMTLEGPTAVLTFDRSPKYLDCTMGQYPEGFEMAGEDRVFHEAKAFIKWNTNQVYVTCPEVPVPVAVRYAFHNVAVASLFGQNGQPVSSFRTDDWPVEPETPAEY